MEPNENDPDDGAPKPNALAPDWAGGAPNGDDAAGVPGVVVDGCAPKPNAEGAGAAGVVPLLLVLLGAPKLNERVGLLSVLFAAGVDPAALAKENEALGPGAPAGVLVAPKAGVDEGAPNVGVDDDPPNAEMDDCPPNAEVVDDPPNVGVEEDPPNAGVDDDANEKEGFKPGTSVFGVVEFCAPAPPNTGVPVDDAVLLPNENADLGASAGFADPFAGVPKGEGFDVGVDEPADGPPKGEGLAPDALVPEGAPNGEELAAVFEEPPNGLEVGVLEPPKPNADFGALEALLALFWNGLGAGALGAGAAGCVGALFTPKLNFGVEVASAGVPFAAGAGAGAELAGFEGAPKLNFGADSKLPAPFVGAPKGDADAAGFDPDEAGGGAGFPKPNADGEGPWADGGGPIPRRDNNEAPGACFGSSGFAGCALLVGCCEAWGAEAGVGAKEKVDLGAVAGVGAGALVGVLVWGGLAKKLGIPLAGGVGAAAVDAGAAGLEKKLGTEDDGGLVDAAEGALPDDAGKGNEGVAGLDWLLGVAAGAEPGMFSLGGSAAGLLAGADVGAGGKPNDGIGGWAGFSTGLGAAGVADGALNRVEGCASTLR